MNIWSCSQLLTVLWDIGINFHQKPGTWKAWKRAQNGLKDCPKWTENNVNFGQQRSLKILMPYCIIFEYPSPYRAYLFCFVFVLVNWVKFIHYYLKKNKILTCNLKLTCSLTKTIMLTVFIIWAYKVVVDYSGKRDQPQTEQHVKQALCIFYWSNWPPSN